MSHIKSLVSRFYISLIFLSASYSFHMWLKIAQVTFFPSHLKSGIIFLVHMCALHMLGVGWTRDFIWCCS